MAGQLRILATSVAGLPAALDAAVTRLRSTITQDVLLAVRERITAEVASAIGALPPAEQTLSASTAVVDLGTRPLWEFWAEIEADVNPSSSVLAWTGPRVVGKDDDETAMDVIDVWADPGDGVLTLRITGQTGPLHGPFTIHYLTTGG